jgi:bifunctional DNase/RNase
MAANPETRCSVDGCEQSATFVFSRIESRRVALEVGLCASHGQQYFEKFRPTQSLWANPAPAMAGATCLDFEMVVFHRGPPKDVPTCIFLHEMSGRRRVCFTSDGWIWWALMAQFKQEPEVCPHPHSAWAQTIGALGGHLESVVVDGPRGAGDWWSAKIEILRDGQQLTVGARAADALTLAVACGAPIFVVDDALNRFADDPVNWAESRGHSSYFI